MEPESRLAGFAIPTVVADGRMEMKARILGLVTVVDETGSPELDRISLRRWLLESPL